VGAVLAVAAAWALGACGGGSGKPATETADQSPVTTEARRAPAAPALARVCPDTHLPGAATNIRASDGTRLYAVVVGTGRTGVVLANDVPHTICEEIDAARSLAREGFRVALFEYRGHGEESASGPHGARLDRDVAAAVSLLRHRGAHRVVVIGSYAGVAEALVAATRDVHIDGLVGLSPAAYSGQYGGPIKPVSGMQAARHLGIPVLYITASQDHYLPVAEARRLLTATGSHDKRLIVAPHGRAGPATSWDFIAPLSIERGPYLSRIGRLIARFIRGGQV
jgi:fermentation-respiration switch protein FrsA (DUF1100 family)